jgi:hypothetical protein
MLLRIASSSKLIQLACDGDTSVGTLAETRFIDFVSRLRIVMQPSRKSDVDRERGWHSLSVPGAVARADPNRLPSIASGTVAADADAPSCGVDWSALQKAPMKPAQTAATPSRTPSPLSAMTPGSAGPGGCHSDPWRAPPNTAELSPGKDEATQSILEIQDTRLDADPVSLYCGY